MPETAHKYFIVNKPYQMVSQFICTNEALLAADKHKLLCDLDYDFPVGIHAIGRLDSLSEGLLILTTNKRVTKLLFQGTTPHKRTYLVRVKNVVSPESLQQLRTGVKITIKEGANYTTPPCEVDIVAPPDLPEHQLELRPYAAHTWLRISMYEGKFHQVRKMVSAINHPCRRLIRTSIEDLELGSLAPGKVREIDEHQFFSLLKIDNWK
jgi:23S rRNA pseudouridine2457 synthase